MKQAYLKFLGVVESLRVGLINPSHWGVSYDATFLRVLPIGDRLSITSVAASVYLVEGDATPTNFSAVRHTREIQDIPDTGPPGPSIETLPV